MLLAQKLALVSLRTGSGHPRNASGNLSYTLVGLLIADLVLQGRLSLGKDVFTVVDAARTGDALLDQVLDSVGAHPDGNSYRQYEYTAKALSGHMGRPIPQVFDSLVDDGLATAHDKPLLGLSDKAWLPDEAARDGVIAGIRASALD
ncbi:MAG: Golgi phosphoprotein 3, partial [Actinomycetota bacterium]